MNIKNYNSDEIEVHKIPAGGGFIWNNEEFVRLEANNTLMASAHHGNVLALRPKINTITTFSPGCEVRPAQFDIEVKNFL